jgi:colanic acid/amylovoran biosynthesis glycosyltransferase
MRYIGRMLTIIHLNTARIDKGKLIVDRKFHVGMQSYVQKVRTPIVSIQPETTAENQIMDAVEVPLDQLGYGVLTVQTDNANVALPKEHARMRDQIGRSKLMYGDGLGSTAFARELSVPYILMREYDRRTQIKVTTAQVSSPLRQGVRALRWSSDYLRRDIPDMRRAHSIHCNGYPMFDETKRFNKNRLLFLDSRMSESMVIPQHKLEQRLAIQAGEPLRLLYSGRYESIKGALDVIRVALECMKLGISFELHCYGQGDLKSQMGELAAQATGNAQIFIHDAVTYPQLVQISQSFDLFVCCHVQADPSCTYLESFGAGLPIVGYDNRMWKRLSQESRVGMFSPIGLPELVANDVQKFARNRTLLAQSSQRARRFALEHCFEREYERRTDAINAALDSRL